MARNNETMATMKLKITKKVEENLALRDEINKLKKTIELLNKDIEKLKGNLKKDKSSINTIKKILSFYARGYTFKAIYEKMLYNGYDVDILMIREVCNNVDDLSNELISYYKKEVKEYEESIKINPDILKDGLITIYHQLINDATEDLNTITDITEKRKIREEINKHGKELNALIKNIVIDNSFNLDVYNEINQIKDEYEQSKDNIIKFNSNDVEVV